MQNCGLSPICLFVVSQKSQLFITHCVPISKLHIGCFIKEYLSALLIVYVMHWGIFGIAIKEESGFTDG